jgi:ATP-binding cassette subfamily C protein/ATP-binding cassette subfamily C exporter for protease/lipase/ATP-binding cassette subfamily C protein EexD
MIAASILLGRALAPVELAISMWRNFMGARFSYDRLKKAIEENPRPPRRTMLPPPSGRVVVEDVSYLTPNGAQLIISEVSCAVEPGEALAIIGPSGAGKSTLCRLIVGLAIPNVGEIRLDGSQIHHWDSEQIGRHIGFLPQDVELFTGTVRDNIARMQVVDDEAIVKAAKLAQAHEMIQHFPQGYDTQIGERGVRLSGGQRQRIGLARAVFGGPRFIVLDEPNANLDQAGEAALAVAIENLKRSGAALIIVGHRPSTLSVADKILFLKEGRVAMFGERDHVLEELQARAAEPIPQGGDQKGPRRLSPDLAPANSIDRKAQAMAGAS